MSEIAKNTFDILTLASAYQLRFSVNPLVVDADANGNITGKMPSTQVNLLNDGVEIPYNLVKWEMVGSGCTFSNSGGAIALLTITTDIPAISIEATYKGIKTTQLLEIHKNRAGQDALPTPILSLLPSVTTVTKNDKSVLSPSTIDCKMQLQVGSEREIFGKGNLSTQISKTTTSSEYCFCSIPLKYNLKKGDKIYVRFDYDFAYTGDPIVVRPHLDSQQELGQITDKKGTHYFCTTVIGNYSYINFYQGYNYKNSSIQSTITNIEVTYDDRIAYKGRNFFLKSKQRECINKATIFYFEHNLENPFPVYLEELLGQHITISYDLETTRHISGNVGVQLFAFYADGTNINKGGFISSNYKGKISNSYYIENKPLKAFGSERNAHIAIVNQSNVEAIIKITNIKFEIGNVATVWSPAPEDAEISLNNQPYTAGTPYTVLATDTAINWQLSLDGALLYTETVPVVSDPSTIEKTWYDIAFINKELTHKVGKGTVISEINQSPESVKIDAKNINLNGVVTANNHFKINLDGSAEMTGAKINGNVMAVTGKVGKFNISDASLVSENGEMQFADIKTNDVNFAATIKTIPNKSKSRNNAANNREIIYDKSAWFTTDQIALTEGVYRLTYDLSANIYCSWNWSEQSAMEVNYNYAETILFTVLNGDIINLISANTDIDCNLYDPLCGNYGRRTDNYSLKKDVNIIVKSPTAIVGISSLLGYLDMNADNIVDRDYPDTHLELNINSAISNIKFTPVAQITAVCNNGIIIARNGDNVFDCHHDTETVAGVTNEYTALKFKGRIDPTSNIPMLICGGEINGDGAIISRIGKGIRVNRGSTGVFSISHHINSTHYMVTVTPYTNGHIAMLANKSINSCVIMTRAINGTLSDSQFSFMILQTY